MNDDELQRLFSDAVSDVHPDDRLEEIRASVRPDPRVVPMSRSRSWAPAVLGTAAVIGIVAYATGAIPGMHRHEDKLGATSSTTHHAPRSSPTRPSPSVTPTPTRTRPYTVFYVGTDPEGRPVLFHEIHRGPVVPRNVAGDDHDLLHEAVVDAVTSNPDDPAYESPWKGLATVTDASYDTTGDGPSLDIELSGHDLAHRPAGMRPAEARAAVQQLVYTAQAALGKRVPVYFGVDHRLPRTLLGVDVSGPVHATSASTTLSQVSISTPAFGAPVSRRLRVTGLDSGFAGSVVVTLERNGHPYLSRTAVGGGPGRRTWPWSLTFDLSGLRAGTYTVLARNDVAGAHPPEDTRQVEVRRAVPTP